MCFFYNLSHIGEIAKDNDGGDFAWAKDHETRSKLWRARHEYLYAALALEPGKKVQAQHMYVILGKRYVFIFYHLQGYITDVCVPISKLPQVLLETKADLDNSPFISEHAHVLYFQHASVYLWLCILVYSSSVYFFDVFLYILSILLYIFSILLYIFQYTSVYSTVYSGVF